MADQDTAQGHERLMDVVAPFVANPQATVLMDPTEGPFHHPPLDAQSAAVFRSASTGRMWR
jgi:hypothetical protein